VRKAQGSAPIVALVLWALGRSVAPTTRRALQSVVWPGLGSLAGASYGSLIG
jgi:hypothetical protein